MNEVITRTKNEIGDKKTIMLVSGGVDSSVCLAVLHKALTNPFERIMAIHIDTGYLRQKEYDDIQKLNDLGYNGTTLINGTKTCKLYETTDPEIRRKIIGDMFAKIVGEYFEGLGLIKEEYPLVQGTLRPDLIESASKTVSHNADVIKTHHNDRTFARSR